MSASHENVDSYQKGLPADTGESYKKLEDPEFKYAIPPQNATPGPGMYPAGQPSVQMPGVPSPQSYQFGASPGQNTSINPELPPSYSSVINVPSTASGGGDNVPPQQNVDVPAALPGYENIGFMACDFLQPPTPFTSSAPSAPPIERPDFLSEPTWTDEEIKSALISYVDQFCCYGSRPAKSMNIVNKIGSNAYHYILETFGESRQVNWTFKPYAMGMFIDGPECGRAPGPWEIPVELAEYFKDVTHKLEIPHTSYVRRCHKCFQSGWIQCVRCFGRGRRNCSHCHGRGHRNSGGERRTCMICHGSGKVRCDICTGQGTVICPICEGNGNLRLYLELTIQWKNHLEDFIFNDCLLPSDLIKEASGMNAFQETNFKVWPVNNFFIPEINQASTTLITRHGLAFPSERILQQRHTIRMVPVLEVKYSWKDIMSDFFVFGLEKKIYAPKYPSTCCCGCTIL